MFEEVTGYRVTNIEGMSLLHLKDTTAYDPKWANWGYELHQKIPVLHGNTAVDVGAFIGAYTLRLAKRFGTVIAFEPNPVNRHILSLNIKRNRLSNIRVVANALGESSALQPLHVPSSTSGMSMGSGSLDLSHQHIDFDRSCLVEVRRLDQFRLAPDFIKIDAEGSEGAILRGAQETLKSFHPTLGIEVHCAQWGAECKCEVCSLLRSIDYHIEPLGELKRENERTPIHWIWAK